MRPAGGTNRQVFGHRQPTVRVSPPASLAGSKPAVCAVSLPHRRARSLRVSADIDGMTRVRVYIHAAATDRS